jgi:large subunit ribosomal protein L23
MAAELQNKRTWGPELEPHQIIIRPLLTEKGTHFATRAEREAERRQKRKRKAKVGEKKEPLGDAYQFEVNPLATKDEIKAAVEELFNVRVAKVRTQNRLGKVRRFRNRLGRLPNWKKAIVTLKGEDRLEFF